MGSFTFRLQKVLDYRNILEDQKEQEFIKSRIDYIHEKDKLNNMYEEMQAFIQEDRFFSDAFHYKTRYNYMTNMIEKIDKQQEITEAAEETMDGKKSEYTDSRKDRKVIDKLKENAFADFKKGSSSAEQKQNDEFALYGYMRK